MTRFIGRRAVVQRINELLSEGQHVSVVAPKSMGKTRLLEHIVEQHRGGSDLFTTAALVDFRLDPPGSMAEALIRFAKALREAFASHADLAFLAAEVDLNAATEELYDQLKLAVSMTDELGHRVLVVLDGCDPVLNNSTIPRNLWDNLRALAQSASLRLMTGTRDQLVNLCYNPEARVSDFFNIFWDEPIRIGPFDNEDWTAVHALGGREWDGAARKEVINWTGGRPDLVDLVLDRLDRNGGATGVDKATIDAIGESISQNGSARVSSIWHDCSDDSRGDVLQLIRGEVAAAEIPTARLGYLVDRGIAVQTGNKVRLANRLIERIASQRQADVTGIRRLFEAESEFDVNIRTVVELRLARLQNVDGSLRRFVDRAIRHLPADPHGAVSSARDILDRALDMIWAIECPGGQVPQPWIHHWGQYGPSNNLASQYARSSAIGADRGRQCSLLQAATGRQGVPQVTTHVSKSTYVLIEYMKQLGDFRNHSKTDASLTMAISFCFAAISLLEALAREIP